jgi:predicted regulator of Ras-like GTPase activity (Roadblock/LC7/MglB family)
MLDRRQATSIKLISAVCAKELQTLVDFHEGIQAAFITTIDGYEVASILKTLVSKSTLSSMTISMYSMGEAVVSGALQKHCHNVTIESETGKIVTLAVMDAREELLLSIMTDDKVPLGQVLWVGRTCAKSISEKLGHQGNSIRSD